MAKFICWEMKCPECGFECSIGFPDDTPEEEKEEIRSCPCGCEEMDIVKERGCRE